MKNSFNLSRRKAIKNLAILGATVPASKIFPPLQKFASIATLKQGAALPTVFSAPPPVPGLSFSWIPVGPAPQISGNTTVSGRVLSIAVSPNFDNTGTPALFLGTVGGIWRSTNFTTASPVWIPLTDNMNLPLKNKVGLLTIHSIAIHPAQPRIIYAAGGDPAIGILKSTDGGNSWVLLAEITFFGKWPVSKIIIDPTDGSGNTLYLSGGDAGIYKSFDGGVNWFHRVHGLPTSFRVSDLDYTEGNNHDLTLYAGVSYSSDPLSQGVWASTDGGTNWKELGMTLIDLDTKMVAGRDKIGRISIAADHRKGTPAGIYVAINNLSTNFLLNVYKFINTTVFGVPVGNKLPSPKKIYTQGVNMPLAISSDGTLFLGLATAGVFKSSNMGADWEALGSGSNGVSPHVDHYTFAFFNNAVYNGNDGGIWRYQLSSTNWESLNTPRLQTSLVNGISLHPKYPNVILVGCQDNATAIRLPGGWRTINNGPGDGGVVLFDKDTTGNNTAAYSWGPPDPNPNFFFKLDDFANGSWVSKGFFNDNLVPFYSMFTIDPADAKHIFIPLGQVFESRNQGETWKPISPVFISKTTAPSAIACSSDGKVIYVAYGNRLFITTNGGGDGTASNWTSVANGTNWTGITAIAVHPTDKQKAYVATDNGRIWFTSLGGTAWTDITGNFPLLSITSISLRDDIGNPGPWIFIGTSVAVYVSFVQNNNTQWQRFGNGLPDIKISTIEYNKATRYLGAATYGRGVFVSYLHFFTNVSTGATSLNNRVFNFAKDLTGRILVNQAAFGQAFSGWTELQGNNILSDTAPAATSINNSVFVFIKGLDRKIYLNQAEFGHAFSGWFEVQGAGQTDTALAAASLKKSVFVFMKGLDKKIYLNQAEFGHAFSGWFEVQGAGRTDTALATATLKTSILVFMKGLDRKIYLNQAEFGHAFSGWFEVQGNGLTDSAPAAMTIGNSVFVFIKGLDGCIYVNQAEFGHAFSGWFEVGGGLQ